MMTHPLVTQLWFSRSELQRCLEGVSDEDARRRLEPMNCISWIVGHLALQEHFYWVYMAQKRKVVTELYPLVGYGQPASQPPLEEMWQSWRTTIEAANVFLETLTPDLLEQKFEVRGEPSRETAGTLLLRNIHHYWFHIGEAHAIRQMLGHRDLPEFVGNMAGATYSRETA